MTKLKKNKEPKAKATKAKKAKKGADKKVKAKAKKGVDKKVKAKTPKVKATKTTKSPKVKAAKVTAKTKEVKRAGASAGRNATLAFNISGASPKLVAALDKAAVTKAKKDGHRVSRSRLITSVLENKFL